MVNKQTVLGLTAAVLFMVSMLTGCISIGFISSSHNYKEMPRWFQSVLSLLATIIAASIMGAVASCVASCTFKKQTFIAGIACATVGGLAAIVAIVLWEKFGVPQYEVAEELNSLKQKIVTDIRAIISSSLAFIWMGIFCLMVGTCMSTGKTRAFATAPTLYTYHRRGSNEVF